MGDLDIIKESRGKRGDISQRIEDRLFHLFINLNLKLKKEDTYFFSFKSCILNHLIKESSELKSQKKTTRFYFKDMFEF